MIGGGWNEEVRYVRPQSQRRKAPPMHHPVKAKVGVVSYQCRKGEHRLHCTKLNCPCSCHDEERDAMAKETRK